MKKSIWQKGKEGRPITETFWEKVDIKEPDKCWEWKAALYKSGYGQIWQNGKMRRAHRVSWEITYGHIPIGLNVCHICDNRKCVNPSHLFLGTYLDNNLDKIRKGRTNRRERTSDMKYRTKLTESDIVQIRSLAEDGMPQREIAKRFGVSHPSIGYIVRREQWKHIK
jgi:hypothetical protein